MYCTCMIELNTCTCTIVIILYSYLYSGTHSKDTFLVPFMLNNLSTNDTSIKRTSLLDLYFIFLCSKYLAVYMYKYTSTQVHVHVGWIFYLLSSFKFLFFMPNTLNYMCKYIIINVFDLFFYSYWYFVYSISSISSIESSINSFCKEWKTWGY